MSKPWKTPQCNMCHGRGEVECQECGSTIKCEVCHGTGYDPETVDVERWAVAVHELTVEEGSSCGVTDHTGSIIGQKNSKRLILVSDFQDRGRTGAMT